MLLHTSFCAPCITHVFFSPQMFIGSFPELQKGNAAFCIFPDASSATGFIPHPAHSAKTVLQLSIEMV